ncbi:polyhydroxyalkanoic acid system family protein [Alteriqipengyuania sp. 357]
MRVPIQHSLTKEEVRRRLRERMPELPAHMPGGAAEVQTEWPNEDCMKVAVGAMGQTVRTTITIEETQVIVELDLPPMLSFFKPLIAAAVADKGTKLLAPPPKTNPSGKD